MNSPENHQLLTDAHQQLSGFRTLQCAQSHEKIVEIVKVDRESNELEHDDHPGWRLEIRGLCSKELRNATIGCSHSMAPINYNRIVNGLIEQQIISEASVPLQEINNLIHRIYLMDHEKGRLEKQLAVFRNSDGPAQEIGDITVKLDGLREEHVVLIKELDSLHQQVLQVLGKQIAGQDT